MSDIEMAAADAAASALSQPHRSEDAALAAAQRAAFFAARSAGADPDGAAATSLRVVAEMAIF